MSQIMDHQQEVNAAIERAERSKNWTRYFREEPVHARQAHDDREVLAAEVKRLRTERDVAPRPHAQACLRKPVHAHGPDCAAECPTCHPSCR